MKKFIRLALSMAIISALFAACKSHEKCPAYGQMGAPKRPSNTIRG